MVVVLLVSPITRSINRGTGLIGSVGCGVCLAEPSGRQLRLYLFEKTLIYFLGVLT